MKTVGYYNGKINTIEELSLPVNDRAVYFGDGVYDVAVAENYRPFALEDHINRFFCSLNQLEIPFEMEKGHLHGLIQELLNKLDAPGNAMIYWQASRGTAPRSHLFPGTGVKANLLIMISPFNTPKELKTIHLITTPETRYSYCNVKTINLIPNIMAAQKAASQGCDEAVFHKDGIVSECAHSNVHILKNGILHTAPTDGKILPGITRMHMLALAQKLSIPVIESAFTVSDLMAADEVLISSTTGLIRRADHVDGVPVGGKDPQTLSLLFNEYIEQFLRETQSTLNP